MDNYFRAYEVIESMTIPFTLTIVSIDSKRGRQLMNQQLPLIQNALDEIERNYSPFIANSMVRRFQEGDKSILMTNQEFQSIYLATSAAKYKTKDLFDSYFNGHFDPTGYVKG